MSRGRRAKSENLALAKLAREWGTTSRSIVRFGGAEKLRKNSGADHGAVDGGAREIGFELDPRGESARVGMAAAKKPPAKIAALVSFGDWSGESGVRVRRLMQLAAGKFRAA